MAGEGAPALAAYVQQHTFMGSGSKDRMVAHAASHGHEQLVAFDTPGGQAGTKAFFSLSSHTELVQYVLQHDLRHRHFYEVLGDDQPVRLWMDVEFLSEHAADGEAARSRLHGLLVQAVEASFSLVDPVVFWGTSTRRDKGRFKHSYQVRVPSVVFPNNPRGSALHRWVEAFAQLTRDEPLLRCPTTDKHIVDTAVYSRARCVRTCFSSKLSDATHTPLRLMRHLGAAPKLFGADHAMPDAAGSADPPVHECVDEFTALMARASAPYAFGGAVVDVAALSGALRCLGVGAVGEGNGAGLLICDERASAHSGGARPKRRIDGSSAGGGDARAVRARRALPAAETGAAADGPLPNRSDAVVQALALLGPRRCESYEDWQNVLFACKNSSASGDEAARRRVLDAFLEWSKRASSFQSDADVAQQYAATPARQGRVFTATSLQRWVAEDPCLVFAGACDELVYDSNGKVVSFPGWAAFFRNIDKKRTDWRCLVRVARHLFSRDEQAVVTDVAAFMLLHASTRVSREDVVSLWNLPRSGSRGDGTDDAFCTHLRAFVRQSLAMPELARRTLPDALLADEEARAELARGSGGWEDPGPFSYVCTECTPQDDGETVNVKMQKRFDDGVLAEVQQDFVLSLADGTVAGTSVNLRHAAWMFRPDASGRLHPDFGLETQLNWATMVARIPGVRENIRAIKQGPWLVYQAETGLWEELQPRDATLRAYVAGVVREYLRPLRSLLVYSVVVLDRGSERDRKQLETLDKIDARFANSDFLDKLLDSLQGVQGVRIPEFNTLFNRDAYLLPCANGMLDFRTLELVPLEREHYYTWRAPVVWDPCADIVAPREFVATLFPDDTDAVVDYITQWFGYCLSGLTNMQTLTFLIGYGSNGKSKLTRVLENILGPTGFAHVSYEALCQRSTGPNEEMFAARHARMWQIDENDGDHTLNFAMIKKITGEDTIKCRQMYGHVVTVPARAKLNFAVNKPPKLPAASDMREQSSLWRRCVYVDCPMQFVDLDPKSKDAEKVALLREELRPERFAACVKQVDINVDNKLDAMTSGFLRLFASALHGLIRPGDDGGEPRFRPIQTPVSIQRNIGRMMRANPALRADSWLNGQYDAGVHGEVLLKQMYRGFLTDIDMDETNYPLSRFEGDVDRWITHCNATVANCKQTSPLSKAQVTSRGAGGRRGRARTVIKHVRLKDADPACAPEGGGQGEAV